MYIKFLKAEITAIDEDSYPGFVECKFDDAYGKRWEVFEKVPHIFTEEGFSAKKLPTVGFFIPGKVVAEYSDKNIVNFKLNNPIEADNRSTTFDIQIDQLSDRQTVSRGATGTMSQDK